MLTSQSTKLPQSAYPPTSVGSVVIEIKRAFSTIIWSQSTLPCFASSWIEASSS